MRDIENVTAMYALLSELKPTVELTVKAVPAALYTDALIAPDCEFLFTERDLELEFCVWPNWKILADPALLPPVDSHASKDIEAVVVESPVDIFTHGLRELVEVEYRIVAEDSKM